MQSAKVNRSAAKIVFSCYAAATIALVGLAAGLKSTGTVFNISASMPDTAYQKGHGQLGSIASICSPVPNPNLARGFCPDGSMPLLKKVVAVRGDSVTVTDYGVLINGTLVPDSIPMVTGSNGYQLPQLRGSFHLQDGEVWLSGQHPHSFDSRYFGTVKLRDLIE